MREVRQIVEMGFTGARIVSVEPMVGGVSARACVVTLLHEDIQQRVVVRRPQYRPGQDALQEYEVLRFGHAAGLAVPRPRYLSPDLRALVLDYVTGAPNLSIPCSPARIRAMAEALHGIHQISADRVRGAVLPHKNAAIERRLSRVPSSLDSALGEGALRERLAQLWPWQQDNPDVLLHGDYWPGNILWDGDRIAAVIDWEESEVGDPLADVALTRLDLLWAFGEEVMRAFTEHYRSLTALNWSKLPHWDLCVALRPMNNLERWAPSYAPPPCNRPDITVETMRHGHQQFVKQALDALGLGG